MVMLYMKTGTLDYRPTCGSAGTGKAQRLDSCPRLRPPPPCGPVVPGGAHGMGRVLPTPLDGL